VKNSPAKISSDYAGFSEDETKPSTLPH